MNNVIGIVCGGLFILIFFAAGVAAIIFGIRNRKKAEASTTWPSVDGTITNAWIDESRDTDEDGSTSTTYTPRWQYQFDLGGSTHTSERVSFGGMTGYGRRSKAEEQLQKFPVNSRVRVYYDPQNPAESVLIQGTKGTMIGIIVGIVLILASVVACIGGGIVVLFNQ